MTALQFVVVLWPCCKTEARACGVQADRFVLLIAPSALCNCIAAMLEQTARLGYICDRVVLTHLALVQIS